MDVVFWSAREAQRRLGPLGSRWAHTQAVAERAKEIADVVAVKDRATLLAAAYLHDVGYAPELATTGFTRSTARCGFEGCVGNVSLSSWPITRGLGSRRRPEASLMPSNSSSRSDRPLRTR
jgi:hypothetical protein